MIRVEKRNILFKGFGDEIMDDLAALITVLLSREILSEDNLIKFVENVSGMLKESEEPCVVKTL